MILQIINRLLRNGRTRWRVLRMLMLALLLNLGFGVAFYFAERGAQAELTLGDSIWWSMVTMTTVGYGDYSALTPIGRFLVSYPCFLLGIGLLGYMLGTFADAILARASRKKRGLIDIMKSNHILICNAGDEDKVLSIVHELRAVPEYAQRQVVLVSDAFQEIPDSLHQQDLLFVRGDPTQQSVLERANVRECYGAIIISSQPGKRGGDAITFAIGSIIEQISREIERSIKVVCELAGAQNREMMTRAGTDGVIVHEGITDCLLVQEFSSPGLGEVFRQLTTHAVGCQFYLLPTRLDGHQISEIQMAVLNYPQNLQVIGLIHEDQYILNPAKDHVIQHEDRLIILAGSKQDFTDIENDILSKPVSS